MINNVLVPAKAHTQKLNLGPVENQNKIMSEGANKGQLVEITFLNERPRKKIIVKQTVSVYSKDDLIN